LCFSSWNKAAERIFGYAAEEAIGQPITIVIPQDRCDEEREILTRIRRGGHIDHFETIRQHKHGNLIAVSLTISPVKNADGQIVGASKILRDISEQKPNQQYIATLAREAKHRSRNLTPPMSAPSEGRILQKAKKLCRRDGKAWSLDDLQNGVTGVTMLTVVASEEDRTEYLNRAKALLETTRQ
jgi:PAS domain S-box-containing protein